MQVFAWYHFCLIEHLSTALHFQSNVAARNADTWFIVFN